MQPEQPIQPTYVPPPVPQKTSGFTPRQKKLMMIVGILLGVFVLFIMATTIFGGQAGPTETTLTSVNARNTGVITIIESFEDDLTTEEGRAYAAQAKVLVMSDNNQLTSYTLSRYGSSFSNEQLNDTGIPTTTNTLASRVGQPNFDSDFISTIQFEVELNKTLLEQLDPAEQSESLQELTSTAINNYEALL